MKLTPTLRFACVLCAAFAASCGSDAKEEGPPCPKDSTLTYTNFGKAFEETYCASCHAGKLMGVARQKAPADDVFDTVEQIRAKSDEVVHEVSVEKSMPFGPDSRKPSDAERTQFGQWVACGAPD
jgi:uncharacterized membrane protein